MSAEKRKIEIKGTEWLARRINNLLERSYISRKISKDAMVLLRDIRKNEDEEYINSANEALRLISLKPYIHLGQKIGQEFKDLHL